MTTKGSNANLKETKRDAKRRCFSVTFAAAAAVAAAAIAPVTGWAAALTVDA